MIDNYLFEYNNTLKNFDIILNYKLETRKINDFLLIIEGSAETKIGLLNFIEVIRYNGAEINKKKYKYNFRDFNSNLIFRFDNAPHHKQIKTFPHHLHLGSQIFVSREPTIQEILQKIQEYIK